MLDRIVWQTATASPLRIAGEDPLSFCGEPDGALARVAARLASRQARGLPMPDALELAFYLRAEGEPHVWPHAWTLSGEALDPSDEAARLRRFLGSLSTDGVRRCGVARAKVGKEEAIAAVIVGAFADLAPLPTAAYAGEWLRFDARMLVPTSAAKLVVLGPSGLPRTVPTTLHDDHVEASFAVERPGPFTVQLLANVERGPRPVLEADVFAGVEAPAEWVALPAPGEDAARGLSDDRAALRAMLDAARSSEGLTALGRDPGLDRAAQEHAEAMRASHLLAHDAGDGGPLERLRRNGLAAAIAGENVAHESSVVRAHRALWASPSHRGNLLDTRFASLGVGVAPDHDGAVWVCEIFVDFAEAGNLAVPADDSKFQGAPAQ
ncbi:MAG TPA: CAP domain-containing protein [Polyangiaceae bacterium]|nr:CAP domain-containing protein [Polyangiaceae bacterium]